MANDFKKLVQADKGLVERKIFSDEELYELELKQIFGRSWLFVGHESQLPKANAFIGGWMAQDPIIVTRDARDKFHVFLNMCRRGGAKVTKEDVGNNEVFECPQHGCLYNMEGQLVAVPGYDPEEVKKIDQTEYGLVPAAHLETYKGLIFATWDEQAPKLLDYLGDMTWYLDLLVDRRSGGTEVIGGVSRWVVPTNWKIPADNFAGDEYREGTAHGAARIVGLLPPVDLNEGGYTVNPGNGHGIVKYGRPTKKTLELFNYFPKNVQKYFDETTAEVKKRLGEIRGENPSIPTGNIFPNLSIHSGAHLRVYHPRAADKTEIWMYCIVDKAAPTEIKTAIRRFLTQTYGVGGQVEQDDVENWEQATALSKSKQGRRVPMNLQMGLGHETIHEEFPGRVSPGVSEMNLRAFYARWAEMMQAETWKDIKIDPKTR